MQRIWSLAAEKKQLEQFQIRAEALLQLTGRTYLYDMFNDLAHHTEKKIELLEELERELRVRKSPQHKKQLMGQ